MSHHAKPTGLSRCALAAVCLFAATTLLAHHSSAMFDKETVREVTATVREFQWTNPHIWIQILIENEDGELEEWSIEGGGTNTLFRRGWRPNSFAPGDEIRIRFNPMKDGSHAGGFIGARLADGSTLGNW
ncbi:MAG: DUF6152 family protein [Woeseiaceae bacterium]|nr:DUF6152 family protein [Woeseiaceae bacterium]